MALTAGDQAPDFQLSSHRGGTVKLSDFRGHQNVVLAFHPLAFTPVCANQMCGYEADLGRFTQADTAVLGVSIDTQPAKAAWAKTLGPISYDMLSDFNPLGAVAQKYGVYRQKDSFSERAVFVIDKQGKVAWSKVYEIPQQPDNEEIFAALEKLRSV